MARIYLNIECLIALHKFHNKTKKFVMQKGDGMTSAAWDDFLFVYLSKNLSSFNYFQDWMPIEKYNSLKSNSFSRAIQLLKVIAVCGPGNILNSPETCLVRNKEPKGAKAREHNPDFLTRALLLWKTRLNVFSFSHFANLVIFLVLDQLHIREVCPV